MNEKKQCRGRPCGSPRHYLNLNNYSKKQIRTNFDLRNSSDLLRLVTRTGIWTLTCAENQLNTMNGVRKLIPRSKAAGSGILRDEVYGNLNPHVRDYWFRQIEWWAHVNTNRERLVVGSDSVCELAKRRRSSFCYSFFFLVTRTGIEPMLQPWKGRVLTAWPTGRISNTIALEIINFGSGNWTWTHDLPGMNRLL